MALTEVQRRKYLFDEIESSNPLKQLAEHCLHNKPQSRPRTNELVSTIQVLDSGFHRFKQNFSNLNDLAHNKNQNFYTSKTTRTQKVIV